jgi:hypothetical protein
MHNPKLKMTELYLDKRQDLHGNLMKNCLHKFAQQCKSSQFNHAFERYRQAIMSSTINTNTIENPLTNGQDAPTKTQVSKPLEADSKEVTQTAQTPVSQKETPAESTNAVPSTSPSPVDLNDHSAQVCPNFQSNSLSRILH